MKKLLAAAALAAISSSANALNDPQFGGASLSGEIGTTGVMVSVALDLVSYRAGRENKAYIKPEDYKLQYSQPLKGGIGGKVNCPALKGPGLKGFDDPEFRAGVACTWKSRPGRNAEIIEFKLMKSGSEAVLPRYRGRNKQVVLRGVAENYSRDSEYLEDFPLTLTMDMYDYRNGNSHKAFLMKTNTKAEGDKPPMFRWHGTCTANGRQISHVFRGGVNNVTGIYGKKPVIECGYQLKQAGKDPHHIGTVVFR